MPNNQASWVDEWSYDATLAVCRHLGLHHASKGGEFGFYLGVLISMERYQELIDVEFDYVELVKTHSVEEIRQCRQAVAFFSKYENLEIGVDREKVAYETFLETERLCKDTNELFRLWGAGEFQFNRITECALSGAQRRIAKVLGPVPPIEKLAYRFGKGSTTLTNKKNASLRRKLKDGVACSEELLPMAARYLGELPALLYAWAGKPKARLIDDQTMELRWEVPVGITDGRLSFAKKNAKTYRTIAKEPPLNVMVQGAQGNHIVKRLARFGVDLRDQSANGRAARKGSLTGEDATIDLKSASDMEATELVAHLLPLEWFRFLAQARTGHVIYTPRQAETEKGAKRKPRRLRITLEKFSSMGNGYTFPLESLIFWALACEVVGDERLVRVYGDDIIVPAKDYENVTRVLNDVGFDVNHKKSYASGPFRESCGKDFILGSDVRPYFQKKNVSARSLYTLHNFYARRGMAEEAEMVFALIPERFRAVSGPDGYGDGHLLREWTPVVKQSHRARGWGGSIFYSYVTKPRRESEYSQEWADVALPAYTVENRTPNEELFKNVTPLRREFRNFLQKWKEGHGALSTTMPLPENKDAATGRVCKATTYPVTDEDDPDARDVEVKKIAIYILG